ncbi:MAG: SlyX family protein [Halomonas subglaciescola]|nr:SlyX family protein [Halomonas subglaciescola]
MPHHLSPAALDARLEELETRLAYQEAWLDTLDQSVIDQQRRLDALEKLSALMRERLRAQHSPSGADATTHPDSEPPPHY